MGKFRCHEMFKIPWSIQLITPKGIMQRNKIQKQKIQQSHEIKRLKSINSKSNLNRHEGILIKTNTHLLKNIRNLEGALQNQRSQCKADLTSN